ncbi:MAG: hypothetical protein EOO68_01785, partial [Moraxellaceae bacterium]
MLAQYFIDRGQCFLGFDLDASHGTFSRFYGEFTRTIKVDDFTSLDNLLSTAEAQPDGVLIVDLAAQTSARLGEWIAQSDALNLFKSLGYEVFWWHVLDDGADALRLLDKLIDTYSKQPVHFVVVKNLGRGEDFIVNKPNGVTGLDTWRFNLVSNTNEVVNLWGAIYAAINRANLVIEGVNANASLLTPAVAKQYIAEAKFLRAFCYYSALQLYAKPFITDNGASLGVPLRLKGEKDLTGNDLKRSTVAEVYTQILKDLNEA